jgi:ferric-chelate reductase (NADPH)
MNLITRTLADTTSKILYRAAEITDVIDHSPHFRSIELRGEALQKVTWTPGDKIQVRAEPKGLTMRTYTPITWDSTRGQTRLLAYAHDTGPGSAWVTAATRGNRCQFFGPRSALKIDDLGESIVFVGDETTFATVAAWLDAHPNQAPAVHLAEVNDYDESAEVLRALHQPAAHLFTRTADSAHVDQLAAATVDALRDRPEASLCLTGKAQTIARVRQSVKAADLAQRPTRAKAYWDENRKGLD